MTTDAFAALDLCNKCGFCQAGCPVYKATGIEWSAARGRIALIKEALDGRLPLDEDMRDPLFSCLTCDGCVDHCPPGVPTARIVQAARHEFLRRQGQPWVEKLLFGGVLPRPMLLGALTTLLWAGQASGLLSLAARASLAPGLRRAAAVLPPILRRHGARAIRAALRPIAKPKYRVALFAGCAATQLFPEVAAATVRVLRRHEAEVLVPDFVCCGKPAASRGDLSAAAALARHNVALLAKLPVDAVITACATCSSFLKEYPELLAGDQRWAEHAGAFGPNVWDIGQFLTEIGLNQRMGFVRQKATWHDPCHLGRFQKLTVPPRQILKCIPGLDFAELPEANACCGGAGFYSVTHHEVSMQILARKLDNVACTEAQLLVTSCPACAIQLDYGARHSGLAIKTVELVQLLDLTYSAYDSPQP